MTEFKGKCKCLILEAVLFFFVGKKILHLRKKSYRIFCYYVYFFFLSKGLLEFCVC